ncbi:MAG: ABC transporter permease [Firmicutes bacterium]|jgi:ABC-type dipeptide/oligopeptide/nickel transport system permease subunit|nr:ABC transporter permease [Bacillota bacterium]
MAVDVLELQQKKHWLERLGVDLDSITGRVLLRFLRNRVAVVSACVLLVFYLIAIFAPWIAPYDPIQPHFRNRLEPPSAKFWFGTDPMGRDLFSRIVYGSRVSLTIGLVSTLVSFLFGIPMGLISGYFGGWIDEIIQRAVEFTSAIPSFFLILTLVAIWGNVVDRLWLIVFVTGIVGWVGPARMLRGQVLAVREFEFIESARAIGCSHRRIMFHHIFPNAAYVIIVQATLGTAGAILMATGLSFLGLGIQPPSPEWGALLNAGRNYMQEAPWLTIFPGLLIFITVLAFNFLGDGLRDAFDPRSEQG